jgi:hypothetical protein
MGTPPAPSNAITVAAFMEVEWQWTVEQDAYFISTGWSLFDRFISSRYMDDTATAVAYCPHWPGEHDAAKWLLTKYQADCYPHPLELEIEDSRDFLQHTVVNTGTSLTTRWQNKNDWRDKRQRRVRLQHWGSYSSPKCKQNVLTQYLRTIRGCCECDAQCIGELPGFLKEVSNLHYPVAILYSAMARAYDDQFELRSAGEEIISGMNLSSHPWFDD